MMSWIALLVSFTPFVLDQEDRQDCQDPRQFTRAGDKGGRKMKFIGEIIKCAGSEKDIQHTIEELLDLNDRIPARVDKEITDVTERQLSDGDYKGKPSRGEPEGITELQFGKREKPVTDIVEVRLETAKEEDGGHRPDDIDNDEKLRGHKDVPQIWKEVYRLEDERKKTDKG